jgi:hypothetical protein
MRYRPLAALALGIAAAAPATADDVYLTNGKIFEGVIAEVTETKVHIALPGGQLSVPRRAVLRVEEGPAPWAEYLERAEALRRDPKATAADWLALARWAQQRALAHGVREAALRAAEFDPGLEGLEPLLRGAGYVLDREAARWIPYAESMRRRGFVQVGIAWISREEHEARQRASEREEMERLRRRAEALEAARAARTDRLLDLAEVQLARELLRPEPQVISPFTWGLPVLVLPGFFPPPRPDRPTPGDPGGGPGGGGDAPGMPPPDPRFPRSTHSSRLIHQPGSLIPGDYAPLSTTNRE